MPDVVFEPPTPELARLQGAINKELAGVAKVNLFIRIVHDRRQWCVLIAIGARRVIRQSDAPLGDEDKDLIVEFARELANRPRPVHSRYTSSLEEADEKPDLS